MKILKSPIAVIFSAIASASMLFAAPSVHAAEEYPNIPQVTIATVANAWGEESILVTTAEAVIPHNCPMKDGYVTHAADPARKNITNLALAALLAGKKVQLIVVNGGTCILGRPRLVSIYVMR